MRMPLTRVLSLLEGTVAFEGSGLATEVHSFCAADLMSDVLADPHPEGLLLTGLATVQAVRTALLSDFRAVAYVRGKAPQPQAVELAREEGLPLLRTELGMFEACGRLYRGMDAETGETG